MKTGGRRKQALLGDAMEAVLAAVYLDGGWEPARDVVLKHWGERIDSAEAEERDPKSALQEHLQAKGKPPPEYVEIARKGPDHAPEFTISARLPDGKSAEATAGSKRAAEQAAARALLDQIV